MEMVITTQRGGWVPLGEQRSGVVFPLVIGSFATSGEGWSSWHRASSRDLRIVVALPVHRR